VLSALTDSLCHIMLIILPVCKLYASGRVGHVGGIYVGILMYALADDLLLILSTCSDLRRMTKNVRMR